MFRIVQLCVLALRLVTPLAYITLLWLLFNPFEGGDTRVLTTPIFSYARAVDSFGATLPRRIVTGFCLVEALFFPYYLYLFVRVNAKAPPGTHYCSTPEERTKLFDQVITSYKLASTRIDPKSRNASRSRSRSRSNSRGNIQGLGSGGISGFAESAMSGALARSSRALSGNSAIPGVVRALTGSAAPNTTPYEFTKVAGSSNIRNGKGTTRGMNGDRHTGSTSSGVGGVDAQTPRRGSKKWFSWFRRPTGALTEEGKQEAGVDVLASESVEREEMDIDDDVVDEEAEYMQTMVEGWFLGTHITDICRRNMLSWTAWAFFGKDHDDMTQSERTENDVIVDEIERHTQHTFTPGFDPDVMSARLTLDPVFAVQRPFATYMGVACMNLFVYALLAFGGFSRLTEYAAPGQSMLYRRGRPRGTNDDLTPEEEEAARQAKPIVFVHGIGIGFLPYIMLILCLPREVDVFLIEWHHVSMQLVCLLDPEINYCPTIPALLSNIIHALDTYGHKDAVFMAHSLGNTAITWMLKNERTKHYVHSTVLLDPVTILLCHPRVATSFVYRDPAPGVDEDVTRSTVMQMFSHFFVARELLVANALSRHFEWSHNIIFTEELPGYTAQAVRDAGSKDKKLMRSSPGSTGHGSDWSLRSLDAEDVSDVACESKSNNKNSGGCLNSIFISTLDGIVPSADVARYLTKKASICGEKHFEYFTVTGEHGAMLVNPRWISVIISKVRTYSGLSVAPNE